MILALAPDLEIHGGYVWKVHWLKKGDALVCRGDILGSLKHHDSVLQFSSEGSGHFRPMAKDGQHIRSRDILYLLTDAPGERVDIIAVPSDTMHTDSSNSYFAHESAYIDHPCEIGAGTRIWHFSHVLNGATIGENCSIGQNVVISSSAVIGNRVKIQNNVSVYDGVTLEDDVFCGPSMVFTNVINPRSEIVRKNEYLATLVRRGATLGANCTIVCGKTIGTYAFVAAGAVITRDVPAYALMAGVPARQVGWMCRCAAGRLTFDATGNGRCSACGRTYRLENGEVSETPTVAG